MEMTLADQSYEEGNEGGAQIVCLNMYAVPKPATDGRAFKLVSCPGLSEFVDVGANVRGAIATSGLFNGDMFVAAGTSLIRIDSAGAKTVVGTIPETGQVTMAASRLEIAVCVAPYLYICDGTTLTQVTDEDLPDVYSVDYINQRFVVSDENDRNYWTDLLDGSSVDGLNFNTAESHPDKLVRVFSDGEKFYSMGSVSIEVMGAVSNPASDADAFARIGSGVIKTGLAAVHAVAVDISTKTVAFLSNERIVYITQGYEPQAISTPYIDKVLSEAAVDDIALARCFAYTEQGETFFVLNIPNNPTFVFGKKMGKWHVRKTHSKTEWRANIYVSAFNNDYVADTNDTKIYLMSHATRTDAGEFISQEFSASAPVRALNEIRDVIVDGYATTACKISMRRRMPGFLREWCSFIDRNLQSPDQPCKPMWRRLGKTLPPEEIFHFRMTGAASVTITGVRANEGLVR